MAHSEFLKEASSANFTWFNLEQRLEAKANALKRRKGELVPALDIA